MPSRVFTLTEIVERLQRLLPSAVGVDTVTELLADGSLDEHSLRPFVAFREDHYARHLVHRSELFDVIVLCWRPGQATPVHNHSGQLGWVRLVRGSIEETTFRGPSTAELCSIDIDDDGVGHGVILEPTGHAVVEEAGTVVSVDRARAIHRLGHPGASVSGESTVTLHVYSRPHDSCLVFDPELHTCRRRALRFDSVPDGAIEGRAP